MALAVSPFTTVTNITTSTALYTVASATVPTFARDLVITSSGASTLFVAVGPAVTSAATTSSFMIPRGQSVLLEGFANPGTLPTVIYGTSAGTASASLGWASVVSVI